MNESHHKIISWGGREFILFKKTFSPKESSLAFLKIDFNSLVGIFKCTLVDLCCGCGVLGISVFKRNPQLFTNLFLFDNSDDALVSSRTNLDFHNVDAKIYKWSAGELVNLKGPMIVLCNPPFVPLKEFKTDEPNWIKDSIYGGEDGLKIVRKVFMSLENTDCTLVLKNRKKQLSVLKNEILNFNFLKSIPINDETCLSIWMNTRFEKAFESF